MGLAAPIPAWDESGVKLDREQDREVLRQAAMILEKENQRLVDENLALQRRLLAALRDRMFGASSEKRPSPTAPRERAPQTGHGPREQPQLWIADVIHVLDDADKACLILTRLSRRAAARCYGYLALLLFAMWTIGTSVARLDRRSQAFSAVQRSSVRPR
jgi:hypothetical protein